MTHIYKADIWESYGRYYVGDVSALSAGSNKWWHQCAILGLSPLGLGMVLLENYSATLVSYNRKSDVFIFYFTNYNDACHYKNDLNKFSRKRKYFNY